MPEPKARIHLDHHASTPMDPAALEAMLPWLADGANPSSVHAAGRAARRAVEDARAAIAGVLGASSDEIVFTSGGTESDNLAVRGGARAARAADASRDVVAFSGTEHPAVREAALSLAAEGFRPVELPVDADGLVASDALDSLGAPVALVSVILASNETGAVSTRLPVLADSAHRLGATVHTDAVQALGKIRVDVRALGVDLLSLTGHKFGGPKGAGALYVKRGTRVDPLVFGGGHEKGRRSGTENVAGIVGLAAGLQTAAARLDEEGARLAALRDRFEAALAERVPGVRFNARGGARLPTCSSAVFPGAAAETLLMALDLEGIAASAGSACSAGTTTPSRVLLACGIAREDVLSTLRFSFGRTSTDADVDRVLEVLPLLVERARGAASLFVA